MLLINGTDCLLEKYSKTRIIQVFQDNAESISQVLQVKKRSNELSEHVIIENSHEIIIPLNGFFCFKNLSVAEKEKDKLNLEISLAYGVITKAEYQMAIVLTDTPRLFSTKNRHISGSDTLAPKSDE